MSVVNGTSEADVLLGTDGNDELYGLESDDVLFASAGSDVLDGGEGFDTADYRMLSPAVSVEVGNGPIVVTGEGKSDTLIGVEKVIGTFGNDTFNVAVGGVTLDGSAGDDVYNVGSEGVTIIEDNYGGYDELRTSLNTMKMAPFIEKLTFTGTGDFKGYGNDGDNEIVGGAGNDRLWGGAGADHFVGGDGFDTVSYSDSTEGVLFKDYANYGGLTIAYGDTFTGIEAIEGSKFDDVFYITDAADHALIIDGSDGYDTVSYRNSLEVVDVEIGGDSRLRNVEKIIGSSSADHFTANVGGVTLVGGGGDDVYMINSAGVTIVEEDGYMGGGADHVYTSLTTMHLDPFVENLTYTGTADFTGYGNDTWNHITGGSGNDVLYGGGSGDDFDGGDGIDVLSYGDSTVAMTLNWATREFSGIGESDTYRNIETIRGSDFNDTFYANGMSWDVGLEGGQGQDLLSYKYMAWGATIDLSGETASPWNQAPVFTGIELIEGTAWRDVFTGSAGNDIFIGGGGSDIVDGRDGHDSVWYLTSASAVEVNLQTGVNLGGAQDDYLSNIEGVMGSHFNDTLTGNDADNYLEGGRGSDLINGGDGNDVIYGGLVSNIGPFSLEGVADDAQADQLYGGLGDDVIVSAENDLGTQAYGQDGNDTLTVVNGLADGGTGDDVLTGKGSSYVLSGGEGNDRLVLNLAGQQASGGFADGGQGDDTYVVNASGLVTIQDSGTSLNDTLVLNLIANASQLNVTRVGNDAYLHSANDGNGGVPDSGVKLADWYAGSNTIEHIQTADGQVHDLPVSGDAFALFG